MNQNELSLNGDDYDIGDKIGGGAYGDVYILIKKEKNENQNLNNNNNNNNNQITQKYAGKIFKPDIKSSFPRTLEREISNLSRINHIAIVKYFGIIHKDNDIIMMTEYIENGSIMKKIDSNPPKMEIVQLTPKMMKKCLIGVSHGMKYLHSHGIMHRDLKTENILINSQSCPKICDFGLSRCFPNSLTNNAKVEGSCVGTPLYMAPEMQNGKKYSCAIDVYSFGIAAFEIVTGKCAQTDLKRDIQGLILLDESLKNSMKPKMKNLIEQCINPNPKKRPSFNAIFNQLSNDYSNDYFDIDDPNDKEEIDQYIKSLIDEEKSQNNEQINEQMLNYKKLHQYDLRLIKILLDNIPSIKSVEIPNTQKNMSLIEYACNTGNLDLVMYLVDEKEIEVNINHLCLACASGCIDLVRYLIDNQGIKPDKKILQHICYSGNTELFDFILDYMKTTINFQDKGCLSLFNYACYSKNPEFIKYLFQMKDKDGNNNIVGEETILHTACSAGNMECVFYLINDRGMSQTIKNDKGMNILHCACSSKNLELVKKLLPVRHPFDLNELSDENANVLHYASTSKNPNIFKYLCSRYDCPNITIATKTNKMTVLHLACEHENAEIVDWILGLNTFQNNIYDKNAHNETALSIAKKKKSNDIIQIFKKHKHYTFF